MKQLALLGVAFGVCAFAAAPADAHFRCRKSHCYEPVCCPPPVVSYVEKTVTCYKPEWKERDVTCTVNKMHTRIEVVPVKYNVMVPVWTEQKQMHTYFSHKPKEVEKDVYTCKMVPVSYTDPCSGCTYTCCKREYVAQKVKCTVWECIPEQKEVMVKVCSYNTEAKTMEKKRVICEWKPEQVTYKQRYCEMVPYQATVKVPVCTPAPVYCP